MGTIMSFNFNPSLAIAKVRCMQHPPGVELAIFYRQEANARALRPCIIYLNQILLGFGQVKHVVDPPRKKYLSFFEQTCSLGDECTMPMIPSSPAGVIPSCAPHYICLFVGMSLSSLLLSPQFNSLPTTPQKEKKKKERKSLCLLSSFSLPKIAARMREAWRRC